MSRDINEILKSMRDSGKIRDNKGKGSEGEKAALAVILSIQRQVSGIVYLSYKYPYQTSRDGRCYLGNIVYDQARFKDHTNPSYKDEIDILFVTPYCIFPIEVKSYHATLEVYDHWMRKNKAEVDKSPIAQSEKHCRHLYHAIHTLLPDGDESYLKPITVFVDRCKLSDIRSEKMQKYVKVCILNTLKKTIMEEMKPNKYLLDVKAIHTKLESIKDSSENMYIVKEVR